MIKITKRIFLIVLAVLSVNIAKSQCVINAQATLNSMPFTDTVKLCLGQTIELQSQGTCAFLMNNDFNNQTLGVGWSNAAANPVFNNPCQCPFVGGQPPNTCNNGVPGQLGPNGAYAWVGTTASATRILETQIYNLTPFIATGGCKIKFWMMYGITSDAGSCEDPDASNEGVHLQYSINNGTTWTDFPGPHTNPVGNLSPTPPFNTITPGSGGYWTPQSTTTTQLPSTLYFWNRYQINLPNNIYTNNTKFRWAQLATSSTGYDAWGIDEVEIVCNAALNTTINWTSNGNQVGTGFNIPITPTQSSWYVVTIKDTSVTPAIFSSDSIYVQVFPNPTSDFTVVSPICSKYSSKITFTGTASNQAVYNWTFGGNTLAYTGSGSGPYDVTWNPPAVGEDSTINTVSLIVVDQNNCTSPQKDLEVIVYKSPEISFTITPQNPAGCQPVDVSITNESEPGNITKTVLWNFGDGATSNDVSPSHTYTAAGVFNISLYFETLYGCKDSTTVTNAVASYPQPVAGFLVSPDLAPKNNAHFNFGNTSTNATIYYWDFGDGQSSTLSDPTHDYFEAQQYTIWLYVNTIWGCKDSISKTVRVVEDSLVFPNIITPNGDGINDYFDITNLNPQSYPTNTLVIYNRWGKKVYIKDNYFPLVDKWDGNGLPEGTYYYVLQYEGYIRKGEFKGSLTILR